MVSNAKLGRMLRGAISVLLIAVVAACSGRDFSGSGAPSLDILIPSDGSTISSVAWLPNGSVYVLKSASSDAPHVLYEIDKSGQAETRSFSASHDCPEPELLALSVLPDGRLGATESCSHNGEGALAAVAVDGSKLSVIADLSYGYNLVAWDPGLKTGWIELDDPDCKSIARFADRSGPVKFPSYRSAGVFSFRPDIGFFDRGSCAAGGGAALVRPAETGDVYFVATNETLRERTCSECRNWGIYSLNLASSRLRKLADGFNYPYDLAVMDHGHALAIAASRSQETGIWKVDTKTGTYSMIAEGDFVCIGASPDGDSVAAARQEGELVKVSTR